MNDLKKINDVFPEWLSGSGIFGALQHFNIPWASENISVALDMEYHGNTSGEKYISPLVNKILSGVVLTETEKRAIASVIVALYDVNWGKQWGTLSLQYNPIENYSMSEKMENEKTVSEYGKTRTRTNDLTHTKGGTETDTPDITETQTPNLTNVEENTTHGFNSSVGVPTGEQTQKATGTNTNERKGTEIHEFDTTDKDTGTQVDSDGGIDTQTRNYTLMRSGNIGVTTSQQMIESERNLWMWKFFHDVVFPDVDRVLALQIY